MLIPDLAPPPRTGREGAVTKVGGPALVSLRAKNERSRSMSPSFPYLFQGGCEMGLEQGQGVKRGKASPLVTVHI